MTAAINDDEPDIIVKSPVSVSLYRVERMIGHGSLRALVHVTIAIGDISIAISGIQIIRDQHGWKCRSPLYKGSNGVSREALQIPQSLWDSVMELLSDEMNETGDPRNSPR